MAYGHIINTPKTYKTYPMPPYFLANIPHTNTRTQNKKIA